MPLKCTIYLILMKLFSFSLGTKVPNDEWILYAPKENPSGIWGPWEQCKPGKLVTGIALKKQTETKEHSDEFGVSGIELYCGPPGVIPYEMIHSSIANEGKWISRSFPCKGYFIGFQLEIDTNLDKDDYAGITNLRLFCLDDDVYEPESEALFGEWTEPQFCPSGQAICGLQTMTKSSYESNQDLVGLNSLKMRCCKIPSQVFTCFPEDNWELVFEVDNTLGFIPISYTYTKQIGLAKKKGISDEKSKSKTGSGGQKYLFQRTREVATSMRPVSTTTDAAPAAVAAVPAVPAPAAPVVSPSPNPDPEEIPEQVTESGVSPIEPNPIEPAEVPGNNTELIPEIPDESEEIFEETEEETEEEEEEEPEVQLPEELTKESQKTKPATKLPAENSNSKQPTNNSRTLHKKTNRLRRSAKKKNTIKYKVKPQIYFLPEGNKSIFKTIKKHKEFDEKVKKLNRERQEGSSERDDKTRIVYIYREQLVLSKTTGFNWQTASDETFAPIKTTNVDIMVAPGHYIALYQVVGICGDYFARAEKFYQNGTYFDPDESRREVSVHEWRNLSKLSKIMENVSSMYQNFLNIGKFFLWI